MDAPKGLAADPVWQKAFWYRGSGIPGDSGTATLAGHVDDVLGRPAVFARLRELRSGDLIVVHDTRSGLDVRFTVVKTATYSVRQAADPAVLAQIYGSGPVSGKGPQPAPDGLADLTLITCAGGFVNGSYDRRLVVYATRSESKRFLFKWKYPGMFRIRRWAVILLVLGLVSGRGDGLANAAPPSPQPPAASPTVGAIADGLILEWRATLPDLTLRADGTVAVNIPGYAQTDTPGLPQLPLTSELVVLPPGARPTLEIIQAAETDLPLPGPLQLAPRPAGVQRDAEGNVIGGAFAESTDTPCLEAQGCPEKFDQPVTLTLLGTMRGVSLARLSFSPVRPVANQLRVTTHIQVVLKFNAAASEGAGFGSPAGVAPSDPLLEVLKRSVINPEQVQPSPLPAPALPAAAMAPRQTGSPRAIVSVAQPGLTAISYASLAAIGFPLAGIDPQSLHLTRAGSEIAMQWDGNGDAVFEAGERLLFVCRPPLQPVDEHRCLLPLRRRSTWLAHDEPPGQSRSATSPEPPGSRRRTKSTRCIPRPVIAGACRRGATAIAGPGTMCASRIVHTPPMTSARSPPWMRRSPRPSRSGSSVTPTSPSSRPITVWMFLSTGSAWAASNGMAGKPSRRLCRFRPACWSPPTTSSA